MGKIIPFSLELLFEGSTAVLMKLIFSQSNDYQRLFFYFIEIPIKTCGKNEYLYSKIDLVLYFKRKHKNLKL